MTRAIAYFRTSSATNTDGDSVHRQAREVEAFAIAAGYELDSCFWDAAVSGADPVESRPGFAALLAHAVDAGVSAVLIENADRFARDLLAQELGLRQLAALGVRVVTAAGLDLSDDSSPERLLMRQIAGAVAGYDKAKTVQRLRAARDRKRALTGRCEGRKRHVELRPELQREARRLARRNPKTGKTRSLRMIAAELAALGFTSSSGRPISPSVIREIVG
jgi:DNA invertase Pin-like site-specific DNA recombinase